MTDTFAMHHTGFDRPIFILSPPRSGSTLLLSLLAQAPGAVTVGGESHRLIERIPGLHPSQRDWHSNVLSAADATPDTIAALCAAFRSALHDRDDGLPAARFRMIEKTPKNSLRIPFLNAAYPDALFVYLYRDPRETLSSMIEAWGSGQFVTYPRLPGWPPPAWSLLLTPGWRDLIGAALPKIVAQQWTVTTRLLLDDLGDIPPDRIRALSYADLLSAPQHTIAALCATLDLGWDRQLDADLPLSRSTLSAPRPDKWRANEALIAPLATIFADTDIRARKLLARRQA